MGDFECGDCGGFGLMDDFLESVDVDVAVDVDVEDIRSPVRKRKRSECAEGERCS